MTDLPNSVRQERQRRERHDREASLAGNLAMIGSLGWLIVLPTLGGVFAGRWLDRLLGSGFTCTGALIVLGVAIGFRLAWRRMHQ